MSDDWCLEFLRFTKKQVCEMTYLLDVPEKFPGRNTCLPTTALSLICYRLAWPHRLKDCITCFGHGKSWLSTVFNYTCVHIARRFQEILRWNDHYLTPSQLSRYCAKIQERGEPSGLETYGGLSTEHTSRHVDQGQNPSIKRNFILDTNTCIQCNSLLLSLPMG